MDAYTYVFCIFNAVLQYHCLAMLFEAGIEARGQDQESYPSSVKKGLDTCATGMRTKPPQGELPCSVHQRDSQRR